ncbi:MAG: ACP S-malonyltransferase [Candidatus Latescibacterota bacterium]|nr:MAG: ACP S-malonyltransferase [Candidatus Latescibacterota bacterium]
MQFAMLFPGQGSQCVGMGADLVAASAEARRTFEEADAVLGLPLARICFEGPAETLTETRNAQPALLVHAVAVLRLLQQAGAEVAIAAGHSLGEYTALVAANVLDFDDALRIVRRRGELMFESGEREPGTMAAVVGLPAAEVERVCAQVRDAGVCDLANLNAPDQIVVSGAVAAIEAALPRLQDAGARVVKRLNVSGAFHSELMHEPAIQLARYLDEFEFRRAEVPVVPNVTAELEQEGAQLRELLKRQIASPVRWSDAMQRMRAEWQGPVLEVGAGNVLRGLLRRIDRGASCTSIGDLESLQAFKKRYRHPAQAE